VLFVSRSNDLARLADKLAEIVSRPGLGALESDVILIQSAGIQRWLSRELSRRLGVLAGARFPFPRAFIREVLDAALGTEPLAERYERESLSWVLFRLLGQERPQTAFAGVRSFLENDDDGSQRLFLAERLANLFDQYVIYRPRMIAGWEKGQDPDDFQACLWREIHAELGPHHFAARVRVLFEEVSDDALRRLLPRRISLVGGPGLPPRFLEVLGRLGRVIDVHVFSFTVCEEYFADANAGDEEEMGQWHQLLRSLSRVGADYQKLLELFEYQDDAVPFHRPSGSSVLHHLQRDLLEGRVRGGDDLLGPESLQDGSITLDACHSPLREVEALQDRLLGFFAEDPTLRPDDIVVLTPQIETYSALISAVFSARSAGRPPLPFRVADRNERAENPAAAAFLLALRSALGRLSASEVLDLLQAQPVQARFGLDAAGLERVRAWVQRVGIRWGADAAHKAEFGLEHDDLNTWRHGLNRLLLGYVAADDDATLFRDVVPFDDVSASDGEVLGSLASYVDALLGFRRRLGVARIAGSGAAGSGPSGSGAAGSVEMRSPAAWCAILRESVPELLAPSSDAWSLEVVFDALSALEERARVAEATAPIALSLVSHLLQSELEGRKPSTDFLAGGITFCELLPLRTIPFRVVCVLGLNQGEFPRADHPLGYDKMAQKAELGDRSIRADDRYLFLEMLLAARDRVALSYVGRSIQDNSVKPPAVVVTELAQVSMGMFRPELPPYLAPLAHPLQPFSARYFDGSHPRLGSSSVPWLRAAETLAGAIRRSSPFVPAGLALPFEASEPLVLGDLVRFFSSPAAAFLRRLDVSLRDEIDTLEDREPVVLGPLERHKLGDRALGTALRGVQLVSEIELRRGDYPAGTPGKVERDEILQLTSELRSAVSGYLDDPRPDARDWKLELRLDSDRSIQISGEIDHLFGSCRVLCSYGKFSRKRRLQLWLTHLVASLVLPGFTQSVLVGQDEHELAKCNVMAALSPERARAFLRELVELYLRGQSSPLRFQVDASWSVVERLRELELRGRDEEAARGALEERALKDLRPFGRTLDPNFLQVFGAEDPLGFLEARELPLMDVPFVVTSQIVLTPLIQHLEGS